MEILRCIDCEWHQIIDNKHWCTAWRGSRRISEDGAQKNVGCEKGKRVSETFKKINGYVNFLVF